MPTVDANLVAQARSGDRNAFAEIVSRYQTLVCSIAYAATGNLATSEELAHESFVSAWRSLSSLQDGTKLRPWLCGIVRNLSNNRLRRRGHDLLSNAGEIDDNSVSDTADGPVETSIAREESELLDRTLASLPETYREPLVLYYREQQSVSRVAEQLELSPSAVKQRLARGRDMLRQEVQAVVERGLLQSAPGRAFTIGVLAAIPIMSGTAKAATITATTAKGVSAMNAAGLAGAILGPLAGIAGGWFGYTMSMKHATSDRERSFIRRLTAMVIGLAVLLSIGMGVLIVWGTTLAESYPNGMAFGIIGLSVTYVVALTALIFGSQRHIAKIRRETGPVEGAPDPMAGMPKWLQQAKPRTYDSKLRFLGVPLLSVRMAGATTTGKSPAKPYSPAFGWIAIGDRVAYGILFASASFAVGGVAFGAVGIGLVSCGGFALGGLAMGGMALGWWATGGLAVGWAAFAGVSIAWKAAIGGVAVSHELGLGGLVVAPHINDDAAKAFLETSTFARLAGMLIQPWGWWILIAFGLLPMFLAYKLVPADEEVDQPPVDLGN